MDTAMCCPVCRGRLSADCMVLGDGHVKAWGWCGCGYRIGAGFAKSAFPLDVEYAVAKALERDGMVIP